MSSIKRPTSARNLIQAIKDKVVTVTSIELYHKDEDRTESITPEAFISDLEFYDESGIFADSIDFKYLRAGKENLLVQIGNMSPFCDRIIAVSLQVNDGISMDDVETQFREEFFFQKSA